MQWFSDVPIGILAAGEAESEGDRRPGVRMEILSRVLRLTTTYEY